MDAFVELRRYGHEAVFEVTNHGKVRTFSIQIHDLTINGEVAGRPFDLMHSIIWGGKREAIIFAIIHIMRRGEGGDLLDAKDPETGALPLGGEFVGMVGFFSPRNVAGSGRYDLPLTITANYTLTVTDESMAASHGSLRLDIPSHGDWQFFEAF
jgi:hypothetical protein